MEALNPRRAENSIGLLSTAFSKVVEGRESDGAGMGSEHLGEPVEGGCEAVSPFVDAPSPRKFLSQEPRLDIILDVRMETDFGVLAPAVEGETLVTTLFLRELKLPDLWCEAKPAGFVSH